MKYILLEPRAAWHAPSCMWVQGVILFDGIFNGSETGDHGMERWPIKHDLSASLGPDSVKQAITQIVNSKL